MTDTVMHSRGQLTVFIILGLIVLVAAGFGLYFVSKESFQPGGVRVAREALPVYEFVSGCASSLAEEAVRLQGLQGGYVTVPDSIVSDPSTHLAIPGSPFVVPFWSLADREAIPTVEFLESGIADYVDANLDGCLQGFAPFEGRFAISPRANRSVRVVLARDEVIVTVSWPVDVASSPERSTLVPDFVAVLPVKLKEIHDLASRVMKVENEDAWLENVTIDLLAANPRIPMDGMTTDCAPKRWRVSDIKNEIRKTVYYNLPTVRVVNAQSLPFVASQRAYDSVADFGMEDVQEGRLPKNVPEDAYEYFRLRWDVGMYPSDVKAAFEYRPDWGMDVDVQPNDGGVLESSVARGPAAYLSFLCINQHHFTYDVAYPVKVLLRDDGAFNGRGFVFQFAFPVFVDDNAPDRRAFGARPFGGFQDDVSFCEDVGSELREVRALSDEPGIGRIEVDGVDVSYRCFRKSCQLGSTEADGGFYHLRVPLPVGCVNPTIIGEKDGYLRGESQLADRGEVTFLDMPRVQKLRVEVVKHPYLVDAKEWLAPVSLADSDNVTVRLSTPGLDQFVSAPGDESLGFVVGQREYALDVLLTRFGELSGGYRVPSLNVSAADIAGKSVVVLHVFEARPVRATDAYSAQVAQLLAEGDFAGVLKVEYR